MVRPDRKPLAERVDTDETIDGRAVDPFQQAMASLRRGRRHGAVGTKHLQACLDQDVFRFNRRTAETIGHRLARLVEQGVLTPPATYRAIVGETASPEGRGVLVSIFPDGADDARVSRGDQR